MPPLKPIIPRENTVEAITEALDDAVTEALQSILAEIDNAPPLSELSPEQLSREIAEFWEWFDQAQDLAGSLQWLSIDAIKHIKKLEGIELRKRDLAQRSWAGLWRQASALTEATILSLESVGQQELAPITITQIKRDVRWLAMTLEATLRLTDAVDSLASGFERTITQRTDELRLALRACLQRADSTAEYFRRYAEAYPAVVLEKAQHEEYVSQAKRQEEQSKEFQTFREALEKIFKNKDQLTVKDLLGLLEMSQQKVSQQAINKRVHRLASDGWLNDWKERAARGERMYFDPQEAEIILRNPRGKKPSHQ
jgi:hypothetical protein